MSEPAVPAISGIHHLSLTVRDLEASLAWYQRAAGCRPHTDAISPL